MINLESLRQYIKTGKTAQLENKKGKLSVTSLLSSNMKLGKGNAIVTGLTLAPFKVINLFSTGTNENYCANGDKCFKTCLFNQSGRFALGKNESGFSLPQLAGIKRALLYKHAKNKFFSVLQAEIALKVAQLDSNEKLYIRLNVMSDIDFSHFKERISALYSQVVFYDYTKVSDNLINKNMAFSIDKTGISLESLKAVIEGNHKISAIVTKETKQKLLSEYSQYCIDGDKHDLFFKESGLFTLLAPKGLSNKQKKDLDKNMTVDYSTIKAIINSYNTLTSRIL